MAAYMTSRISAEMPSGGRPPTGEGAAVTLPPFLHDAFAAAMSQSLLLPAFVALFGVVAALFLRGQPTVRPPSAPTWEPPEPNYFPDDDDYVEYTVDRAALDALLEQGSSARLLYGVPNFQNPSGVSYSRANREALAERLVRQVAEYIIGAGGKRLRPALVLLDLKLPGEENKKKGEISFARIAIWVIVGGVGLYLVISGVVGIIVKGQ